MHDKISLDEVFLVFTAQPACKSMEGVKSPLDTLVNLPLIYGE